MLFNPGMGQTEEIMPTSGVRRQEIDVNDNNNTKDGSTKGMSQRESKDMDLTKVLCIVTCFNKFRVN